MMATDFFNRSLRLQRNSVNDEFYERNAGLVFEKDETKTRMEVRCWSNMDLTVYGKHSRPHSTLQRGITAATEHSNVIMLLLL
jgi:hypothetical protein